MARVRRDDVKAWLYLGSAYVAIWVVYALVEGWSMWPPTFLIVAVIAVCVVGAIPSVLYYWSQNESALASLNVGMLLGLLFVGGMLILVTIGALLDGSPPANTSPCTPASPWNC